MLIRELKIEDADVKDDVKMALYAHVWIYHAIFTSSLTSASLILTKSKYIYLLFDLKLTSSDKEPGRLYI